MTWDTGTFYSFDTETSGVNVFTDRIVSAAVVKITDGQVVADRTWLLNPQIEIPEAAINVHGITNEYARENGQDPALGIADITDVIVGVLKAGLPLVVANAPYDLSLLESECRRHGLPGVVGSAPLDQVIDPLVLAKGLEHVLRRKFVKGYRFSLPALCERYKIEFEESHDARADAVGAGLLACALAREETSFVTKPPAALHQLQATWHREDMRSLRAYFDKRGTEHDGCDGSWPLHSDLMAQVSV